MATSTEASAPLSARNIVADVLFTFDTTGSMYPCLKEVQRNIGATARKMFAEVPNLRIAVMAHGDYCDESTTYLTKHLDFTQDVDAVVNFVSTVESTGGGDYPEAYEYVLRESRKLSWRIDATMKSVVIIGDAPPHEPYENPEKIDWREEAERLRDRNVQIFSIQCLNNGNRDAYTFYSTIAQITNGYHLFLDQFSYIKDMLQAVVYRQSDEEQLGSFEREMQARAGGLTEPMRLMFDTMLGRRTREEVAEMTNPDTFRTRYVRETAAAPRRIVATADEDDASAIEDLRPCPPTKFQTFTVETDVSIQDFCREMGIRFARGKGFYEFTKPEIVQPNKEIVLMKRDTGDLYEGDVARRIAGIPRNEAKARITPGRLREYRVFIQSTSPNRKLINGQGFLFEVSYT